MIADRVARHARLAGGRTAVVCGDERLSYAELDERSDRLAARLRQLDLGPERVAGVLLGRELDLPVALLAVLKTGAAYLPLDPQHPDERIAFQLRDVRAGVLLTNVRLADRASAAGSAIVRVDETVNVANRDALAYVRVPIHAHGIAYVMHTSGSTGRPKPVAVTHGGLQQHATAVGALLGLTPEDRVLQHASVAFDVSAEELYPTWCAGATVVMAPAAGLPAAAFERLLAAHGVSVVNLPSGYFGQWARHVVERGARPPACLRLVVVGSEAADGETAAAWLRHTGVPVVNAYGVTEATITTTAHRVRPAEPARPLLPIGRPLPGAEVHLLDAGLRPVAAGEAGELCIGGAGVARGYHGRPALTAERFVPHPEAAGQRLYRTGDLARRLPDGALELLGRADDQIKVRGHRVEPAEVAAALRAHPDVEDAHVVHHQLARGGCLTGYVVVRDPARAPAEGELRARLRRRLPEFMVPQAFVVLDRLPRTATGKIDRRALPVPAPAAATARHEPPVGETERTVAGVWREVLGVERVGRHDDFLALSGNSLLAVQLLNRLHAATGAELSLRELLASPTVAGLARLVTGGAGAARPAPPALAPGPRRRLAPLSAQQEQLWLVCKLAPESVAYNVQTSVRIAGEVRVEPLERALTELVRRHEILRTTFEEVDGRPLQVIHAPWPVTVARVDLREHPPAERPALAEAAVERELARPFDLGRLPLLRWTLLQLDDAESELLVVEHHLLTDGTSLAAALRELTALYDAYAAGEEPAPADPPLQYADYARWQQAAAGSPALRAQLAHWTSRLAGAPPALELVADRPRPRRQSFAGGVLRTELPAGVRDALRAFCRERQVTLFSGLLAAFVALLHRSTGADDLCVGSAFANRAVPGSEALLGMLVNTVVLRWELGDDPSFAELVARTHEEFLDASAHQELPFRWLVEALNPARDGAVNPMVQVMFSFDNAPLPALGPGGPATVFERHNGSSKMDLNVIVEPWAERGAGLDDRVVLRWEYDAALFEPATVGRAAERMTRLLGGALARPDARLSELPLLAAEERERVTTGWNETAAASPEAGRVTELVLRRAAAAPGAPAVVTPAASIDYGTLVRRAGAVAAALRAAGVGAEATVGVLASRSVELAVANLGVLLAGAAYVPLDPEHPAGRLAFIARDAGVATVLADRGTAGAAAAALPGVVWLQDVADAPAPRARLGGLAYVMYTSGSTGTPKGVAVEHRGLENLVGWHRRAFALGAGDRVSMVAAPGFDASAWELWPALAAGAAIHVPDAEARLAPERMRDWLLDRRITVAFLPTPLAEAVLALPWPAAAPLRLLLTGGDRLRVRPDPGLPFGLVNNYGPTENTVVATSGPVTAGEGPAPGIGGPIDNVRAYVVDRRLAPVPPGVPGELLVGGAGLARGYRGRPGLTAERFVPSPFGGPGERLYRTGDRARWRADGTLEFLGRADEQVKIRGFRVEPAEIVAALAAHPAVRQADVAVREAGDERRLVAYVVGEAVTAEELREHCAGRLPAYMVPATFHLLDALPLLPSGKVDRRALAELAPAPAPAAELAGADPRGETEERIAGVWREVLGVERVGRHDSFFDLGGHSLLSARIAVRLGQAFGIKVPLTVLFDHPTVAGLATVVRSLEPVDA